MRIKGLLRALDGVRARLRAGLKPEELDSFAAHVRSLTRQVEEICVRHGVTPEHLPGPSRRAYRFLKELDLYNLPVQQPGQSEPPPTAHVAVRNLCSLEDALADRFWHQLPLLCSSADARTRIQKDLKGPAVAIEDICARRKAAPSALQMPSRQVYCWLKFLLDEENLTAHLAALERAKAALMKSSPLLNLPVTVHLLNMGALWRKRQYRNLVLLKVNEGFLNAEPEIWEALMNRVLSGHDSAPSDRVREFADSEDFGEVLAELESFAEPGGPLTQGCVHNLEASFARVNAGYFGGSMPRPKLVWNRTLTGCKFGHYQRRTDTVMLSVSLDAPQVPSWLVDFVMYHELLHKKHGITRVNGRRFAHTAAFRGEERLFAEYERAERLLKQLAGKHR